LAAKESNSLVIPTSEFDAPHLLGAWSCLVAKPGHVLGLSPFGDWFLQQPGGAVWRLDLLEGTFLQVAASADGFWALLETDDGADDLLQAGTVEALMRRGLVRVSGQCYTYSVHPRLGGPFEASNMRLGDIGGWQLFCSQLHAQLDAMPSGARISGLRVDPDGALIVEWQSGM